MFTSMRLIPTTTMENCKPSYGYSLWKAGTRRAEADVSNAASDFWVEN